MFQDPQEAPFCCLLNLAQMLFFSMSLVTGFSLSSSSSSENSTKDSLASKTSLDNPSLKQSNKTKHPLFLSRLTHKAV